MTELRCGSCNKKLGENFHGRIEIKCPRCGHYSIFISTNHKLDNVKSPVV
ncbi:hypothetical protein LCGC14_1704450 [marine sediment metagenome]|uniref:Com family DNA-binding transcriptional regulator n=1 Tax=marine sediment metagenome TaxID=412755 RepID=A0A0F9JXJ1_9ZZZZ